MIILNICFAVYNLFLFFVYGYDKLKAKKKGRRVPEVFFLVSAFLFAGIGSAFGMLVFNHKTTKMKFRILIPLFAVVNVLVFRYLCDLFNIIVN